VFAECNQPHSREQHGVGTGATVRVQETQTEIGEPITSKIIEPTRYNVHQKLVQNGHIEVIREGIYFCQFLRLYQTSQE